MPTTYIPKLARNKYNYVKGADGKNYVTQSQLMMSSGGSGGGNSQSGNVVATINQTIDSRGLVSYNELKTINGYSLIGEGDIEVTGSGTVDLSAYATKSYVADYVNTYAPTADLSSYVSKTELDERLSYYSSNDVDVEDEQTKTVSQDDGIIVLTYSSANNSVTLPTTDIKDGKVIYIINKTGRDYTLYTAGEIVEKSAASKVQSQTISDNIIQCIYYDSEWFVV